MAILSAFSAAGTQSHTRLRVLPQFLAALLFATLGIFYAANLYSGSLQQALSLAKWAPLALLLPTCFLAASRQKGSPSAVPLVVLLIGVGSSVAAADNIAESFEYFLSSALMLSTAWYLAVLLNSEARRSAFLELFEDIGKIVLASASMCWLLGINLGRAVGRFSAWTDNPNTLGLLLAPVCVIWIGRILRPGRRTRKMDIALATCAALFIVETGSRASMLWVITASIVFLVARRGVSFGLIAVAITVFVLTAWSEELNHVMVEYWRYRAGDYVAPGDLDLLSGRDELWRLGTSLWWQSPWLGYGPGSEESLINRNASLLILSQGLHFHDSYLSTLVEHGLLGLLALLVVIGRSILRGTNRLLVVAGTPRISVVWTTHVLPLALVVGALAHAFFETWLLNGGNANALAIWTLIWLLAVRSHGSKIVIGVGAIDADLAFRNAHPRQIVVRKASRCGSASGHARR
jgi:O-antigen ligase